MRSNFARRRENYLTDSFRRDLKNLLLLSDEARQYIARVAVDVMLKHASSEYDAVVEEIGEKFPDERSNLVGPLDIMLFFARVFASDSVDEPAANDKPEDIASDFAEIGDIYPDGAASSEDRFAEALRIVKDRSVEVKNRVKLREYAKGVLPGLRSVGTTVELRAVFDKKYKFRDKPDEYAPSIVELVPIASIKLGLANTVQGIVSFQVDEDELSLLVDSLRATQVEFEKIKEKKA